MAKRRQSGRQQPVEIDGTAVGAFIPLPLPPSDPPLDTSGSIDGLHAEAMAALARLQLAGRMVPSPDWFLYGFVRKEAVLTSQIEGTQATLQDVLEYEATDEAEHPEEVEEVCNYVEALTYARRELSRSKNRAIDTKLLCGAHKRLMKGSRGANKKPGAIRAAQNWIGGQDPSTARFVPPPPDEVPGAIEALLAWTASDDPLPPLIRAGLAHAQFETIHPFLDGNGRIGRLLIMLLLERWGVLDLPILYLSLALKRRQLRYYDRLMAVRQRGDWEAWIEFYLECVRESADDGTAIAQELFALLGQDRQRLTAHERATVAAIRLHDLLPSHPIVTAARVEEMLGITAPTARKAIEVAEEVGILRETTGKPRDRVYAYHRYLKVLTGDEG
ncbi:MAG: Fic family protein [Phycisphaeraceae bacterium]|nr:Fic family protein [Phycisphaerales bacterium]MCB9843657.1 Fic family protein [Phycisphaeraceae bacterium]